MSASHDTGDISIPSLDDVRHLIDTHRSQSSSVQYVLPGSLRALVVEVALYNSLRYPWADMKPVYHILIDNCLDVYRTEGISEDEEETATLVGKTSVEQEEDVTADLSSLRDDTEIFIRHQDSLDSIMEHSKQEIHNLLDAFESGPPFTIQRLSEILLEPRKQYTKLNKVLHSLKTALMVTTTYSQDDVVREPTPQVTADEFSKVNENPISWYNNTANE